MVVLHTSSVYEALKDELVTKQEGMRFDVGSFFSLPVPQAVWEKIKRFQNKDFVAFVEMCRRGADVVRMVALVLRFAGRNRGLDAFQTHGDRRFVTRFTFLVPAAAIS